MSKHTPGPWRLWGSADPSQVISAADCFVAQTVGGNDKANARLIAAAPELLEALQDLFGADMEFHLMGDGKEDQIAAIAKARAAIAKATGETP
jgi:hypothetical protein